MTSPAPLLYDTYYHIYNRGNNRENIFIQEGNYVHFLNLYGKYIPPIADTFAYCLLRNHFHFLIRIKSEQEILETLKVFHSDHDHGRQSADNNGGILDRSGRPLESSHPSKHFSDFFNAYAKAINKAYCRSGSLFQHPIGRVMITSDRQFGNVIAYIHSNPQKHKFTDDFRSWKYSSYGLILSGRPGVIQRDAVIEWFGGEQQYIRLHAEWVTDSQSKWFSSDDD